MPYSLLNSINIKFCGHVKKGDNFFGSKLCRPIVGIGNSMALTNISLYY